MTASELKKRLHDRTDAVLALIDQVVPPETKEESK